mmetsp:Transcript_36945/g.86564  ORF Transcript_36945/g.86564 Transcript_36945/m.86564 type:complete len:214 (-) Transcript_36945:71-712(-)
MIFRIPLPPTASAVPSSVTPTLCAACAASLRSCFTCLIAASGIPPGPYRSRKRRSISVFARAMSESAAGAPGGFSFPALAWPLEEPGWAALPCLLPEDGGWALPCAGDSRVLGLAERECSPPLLRGWTRAPGDGGEPLAGLNGTSDRFPSERAGDGAGLPSCSTSAGPLPPPCLDDLPELREPRCSIISSAKRSASARQLAGCRLSPQGRGGG